MFRICLYPCSFFPAMSQPPNPPNYDCPTGHNSRGSVLGARSQRGVFQNRKIAQWILIPFHQCKFVPSRATDLHQEKLMQHLQEDGRSVRAVGAGHTCFALRNTRILMTSHNRKQTWHLHPRGWGGTPRRDTLSKVTPRGYTSRIRGDPACGGTLCQHLNRGAQRWANIGPFIIPTWWRTWTAIQIESHPKILMNLIFSSPGGTKSKYVTVSQSTLCVALTRGWPR